MTFEGFSEFFFCARERRAASATESWDCANATGGSNAEAKTIETARGKEIKRDMMQLLVESGIGSILKIRCRNGNDNAKLRTNANPIIHYEKYLFAPDILNRVTKHGIIESTENKVC
jgi:hypothetical protein